MKKLVMAAAIIATFGISLQGIGTGPSKKQQDQAIVQNIIAAMKQAQRDSDEKSARAIQENGYAIIPTLKNLSEEERAIALSQIDEIVSSIKKAAARMPAAPGGPCAIKSSERERKQEAAAPKKVVKQKPMSEAAKERRYGAQEMQRINMALGYNRAKERSQLSPQTRNILDKKLFENLSNGAPLETDVQTPLRQGADTNALVATKKSNKQNSIMVPAFWGLIEAAMQQRAEPAYLHDAFVFVHRFGANLDLKASDGTPILNYMIAYWPNWETADHLPFIISQLMTFGVDLNATDANGDTFLDVLLKRFDDPLLTGQGKRQLDWIINAIDHEDQRKELQAMIEDYKQEHIRPMRAAARQPARAGEAIQEPGVRRLISEYLLGEEEPAAPAGK